MHKFQPATPTKRIKFYLVESDDFFHDFAIRHTWTPFEAACLICGMKPGPVVDGKVLVGVVSSELVCQQVLDEFKAVDAVAAIRLLTLARSVRQKWLPKDPVATEVIEWAVGKGLVWDTPFVRMVLGRVPEAAHLQEIERLHQRITTLEAAKSEADDGRGKHHEEKRMAILGAAIQELAKNLTVQQDKIDGLFRADRVNSSALANHLHEHRRAIGLPEENIQGYGYRAIADALRKSLAAADRAAGKTTVCTDKNSVTTD
jgi:hypothetical protein